MRRTPLPSVIPSGFTYSLFAAVPGGGTATAVAQPISPCWRPHCFQNCDHAVNCPRLNALNSSESFTPLDGPGISILSSQSPETWTDPIPLLMPVCEYAPAVTARQCYFVDDAPNVIARRTERNLAFAVAAPAPSLKSRLYGHPAILWADGPSGRAATGRCTYEDDKLAPTRRRSLAVPSNLPQSRSERAYRNFTAGD